MSAALNRPLWPIPLLPAAPALTVAADDAQRRGACQAMQHLLSAWMIRVGAGQVDPIIFADLVGIGVDVQLLAQLLGDVWKQLYPAAVPSSTDIVPICLVTKTLESLAGIVVQWPPLTPEEGAGVDEKVKAAKQRRVVAAPQ